MGLLFGIHIMRGIPQTSYKSNTPIANSTYTAQQAGNSGDTTSWDPAHNYGVNGDTRGRYRRGTCRSSPSTPRGASTS